jgi:hypothetical protein
MQHLLHIFPDVGHFKVLPRTEGSFCLDKAVHWRGKRLQPLDMEGHRVVPELTYYYYYFTIILLSYYYL